MGKAEKTRSASSRLRLTCTEKSLASKSLDTEERDESTEWISSASGLRINLQHVVDAAQLRGIHDFFGRKVGREYNQLIEQERELLAGVKGKIVQLALERKNPPVQEIMGAYPLAAEVIDNEYSADGL